MTARAMNCDVLVVGAGPAGLSAALMLQRRSNLRIVLVDAGDDIEPRARLRQIGKSEPNTLVRGVGGAGLFSDGKLCLSLDVGGTLPGDVDAEKRSELLREVIELFDASRIRAASPTGYEPGTVSLGSLTHTSYPVAHVGTDRAADRIKRLRNEFLQRGGLLLSNTALKDIEFGRGRFLVQLTQHRSSIHVSSRNVILAMGKVGAAMQAAACRALGATTRNQPMDVGLRLEAEATDLQSIFARGTDPKFKMMFADGSRIKTHCVAAGGEILRLQYDGLPLAGGHSNSGSSSKRTSMSLLWNGIRQVDSTRQAHRIMDAVHRITDGRLLAQTLADYRNGFPSSAEDVAAHGPSLMEWHAGDVRSVLPRAYFAHLDAFLGELAVLCPGIVGSRTLLFAAAIEWWADRVETDMTMQTEVPGLYAVGDGGGWSQGIVQASASGILAAGGVVATEASTVRNGHHRVSHRPAVGQ